MIRRMELRFLLRFVALFAAVFAVLFMAVWFYLSMTQPAQAGDGPNFARTGLSIQTQDGRLHDFRVEVARTPEQLRHGLMYREALAPDAGMVFVYDPPRPVAMWMKNTYIALDMLFADAAGQIFHIHEQARPHDESLIMAPNPRAEAGYVLELPAGTVADLKIGRGDVLGLELR